MPFGVASKRGSWLKKTPEPTIKRGPDERNMAANQFQCH